MGKYAVYVWSAYGATALTLGALVVLSLRVQGERRRKLEALRAAVAEMRGK